MHRRGNEKSAYHPAKAGKIIWLGVMQIFLLLETLISLNVHICIYPAEGAGTDGYEAARRARIGATSKRA